MELSLDLDRLRRAGYIARVVLEDASRIVKPGSKLIDIAQYIENRIRELGGEPAFPVNIGVNDIAAHYTPVFNDQLVIPDNSIVKIDVGVHIDGYIADTALTISFNPIYEGLVEASRKALEKVIEFVKPGVKTGFLGKVIEETISSMGYKVIKNLGGHGIERYTIHTGVVIPNHHDPFNLHKLTDGVYAIEPFATNGKGYVRETDTVTIYSLRKYRRAGSDNDTRILIETIWSSRRTLPFCERWYINTLSSPTSVRKAIESLDRMGLIHRYPVLVEIGGGMVSQFEHTFVIHEREVYVTTLK
uniref:Methionine aminopeptidase n=1 Tax=Staphylothermus marinus TaxID=2280 RepID=A0A7C4JM63_STAMA